MQLYRANKKAEVLEALSVCTSLAEISSTTGVKRRTLYNWLREDEELKARYEELTAKGNKGKRYEPIEDSTKNKGHMGSLDIMAKDGWNIDELEKMPNEIVYFISDGDAVKVGKTKGLPYERLKSLQTGNPRELELLMVAYANNMTATNLETWLHGEYHYLRVRGEWYSTTLLTAIATKRLGNPRYRVWTEQIYENTVSPTLVTYLTGCYGEKCMQNKMDYSLYKRQQEIHERYVSLIKNRYAELMDSGEIEREVINE